MTITYVACRIGNKPKHNSKMSKSYLKHLAKMSLLWATSEDYRLFYSKK